MRVLVANEPRSYREVIATAFQIARPHLEARAVEPQELDREVLRVRPDLVICDRLTPAMEVATHFWIEYRVENGALVVAATNVCGLALRADDDVGLDGLLWVIDRTEELTKQELIKPTGRVEGGQGRITSITRRTKD